MGTFSVLLFSLVLIAGLNRVRDQRVFQKLPATERVLVTIQGAVAKPGTFQVLPGTSTLGALLKKAGPKRFAHLEHLDLKARIEGPCEFYIEELKEIAVHIRGAVLEEKTVHVPAGTRLFQLRPSIAPVSNADLSLLKGRRMLKHEEVLVIPEKVLKKPE